MELNKVRVLVDALEHDLEEYELCNPINFKKTYNPLVPWFKLILSVFGGLLSLLWVIHIILYVLFDPPLNNFLNEYFTWFDSWFPFLGTISVGIFSMYLLVASIKGAFKFGTRFFLIKIHPMERKKTLINSFLFNVALVLIIVLPVAQFTLDAFSQYARLTDADVIFGAQVRHMEFFRYVFRSFTHPHRAQGLAVVQLPPLPPCLHIDMMVTVGCLGMHLICDCADISSRTMSLSTPCSALPCLP